MGTREVPFGPTDICDECGATGAYDFMGDYLCPICAEEAVEPEVPAPPPATEGEKT